MWPSLALLFADDPLQLPSFLWRHAHAHANRIAYMAGTYQNLRVIVRVCRLLALYFLLLINPDSFSRPEMIVTKLA